MTQYALTVVSESVAANSVETLLQVAAPSGRGVSLIRWGVSFNGVSASEAPVRVELMRMSSAGVSTTLTPRKIDPLKPPATASGLSAFTQEPTVEDLLEVHQVTPFSGLLVMQYAPDERIQIPSGGRLGIRLLAAGAVNATGFMVFDE